MLPHVILHNAVSLDGRTVGFMADVGLYYEITSCWNADAVLSGSNTALAAADLFPEEMIAMEEAEEREPIPDDPRPLLVVVDSRGRVRN
ncbi:MAG TPA: 5-amino-6-(5-phosphoribosylamino)uracil reductase, partial [Methanomicrobiales archaeon]|nr:5-amino-6-(5-phosphoribosylamino)uracil reductase [Methanomicrobiales archaeon]